MNERLISFFTAKPCFFSFFLYSPSLFLHKSGLVPNSIIEQKFADIWGIINTDILLGTNYQLQLGNWKK